MPAKGKSKISPRQKLAIAKGRVSGKTVPEIAKATGISEGAVAHIAVGPDVKGIISQAMVALQPQMFGLMAKVVASLEADIDPDNSQLTYDQRERARNQAVTVLQLGQPKQVEPPASGPVAVSGGGVFLGDMLTHYRSIVHASPLQEPQ